MPSPLYAEHEGATVLVHAYLSTPSDEARFLSVGGPAEAVKAVLAGLASGHRVPLFRRTEDGRAPAGALVPDGTPWRLEARRLPCGQVHGLLSPRPACEEAGSRFTLLLPRGKEAEAPRHLLRLLDARTTLPLHPSWAPWLWELCEREEWLTRLTGEGEWTGWDVQWSEPTLTERVSTAIFRRALRVA
jgi:hypothetical protein